MNFGNIAVLNMTASNEELILSESLIFCLKTFELDCPHHHNWVVTSVEEERNASCLISRFLVSRLMRFRGNDKMPVVARYIHNKSRQMRCRFTSISNDKPIFFLIEPAAAHRRPQVG